MLMSYAQTDAAGDIQKSGFITENAHALPAQKAEETKQETCR